VGKEYAASKRKWKGQFVGLLFRVPLRCSRAIKGEIARRHEEHAPNCGAARWHWRQITGVDGAWAEYERHEACGEIEEGFGPSQEARDVTAYVYQVGRAVGGCADSQRAFTETSRPIYSAQRVPARAGRLA